MAEVEQFDAVIVGAGLTGATLALALARAGRRPALVDAQPITPDLGPDKDGRASAVSPASMRQWRALGVWSAIEAEAEPIRSILVTDAPNPGASAARGAPGFLRFDGADLGGFGGEDDDGPLGWMAPNHAIRATLNRALIDSGVALFAPARLASLQNDARAARITLSDGRALEAPLVVGAEGRVSPVRTAAGIKTYGWDYPQAGVVATVALAEPQGGVAHELFLPGGPLAILPLSQQRASLVWSERKPVAKALVEGSVEAFEAHLARRFGDQLGAPRLIGGRFSFPLALQMAERMTAERVALIGDAAHAIHPVAGQGLNLGLKDAAALAEVVVDAARLGEDWGSALVLDRYTRWRRFDAASLAAATDLFTRLFSNDIPGLRAVRGVGLALVNRIAPARRFFVREAAGLVGEIPRLMRGEAL